MAQVLKYKGKIYPSSHLSPEWVEVEYDFANDGGATGNLDLFQAGRAMVILDCIVDVLTDFTSGGSATLSVGKTSDEAGVVANIAVANLVGAKPGVMAARDASHVMAADDIMELAIGTAAMTAGKCRIRFLVAAYH